MSHAATRHDSPHSSQGRFATTQWTMVLAAGKGESSQAEKALAALCQTYWYPLYAYIRRRGHSATEAEDLTQEYFFRLIEKEYLSSVEREKGRFRSFLLASLKHFLANEWDRAKAAKRGGGHPPLPLDVQTAETRYQREPATELTPDKLFDRQWVIALLSRVLERLRAEYAACGQTTPYEQLKPYLTMDQTAVSYPEAAARLKTTEGAVKTAVYRLRKRYRDFLRAEIAQTVSSPDQVEEEIQHLFAAFE